MQHFPLNGCFLRVNGAWACPNGDRFLLGLGLLQEFHQMPDGLGEFVAIELLPVSAYLALTHAPPSVAASSNFWNAGSAGIVT